MALFVDYGLVTAQRAALGPQSWQELYDDVVALATTVEDAGFDGLWVSEHHFTADGYMSALFPVLGALAARTERLVLGTNVALAPLYQPLRLAEDAAAVSLLSHGRFLLGLAIGYRDEEFTALGVPKRRRVPLLEECVATCRGAWTGEPFERPGQAPVVVRPAPETPPPLWLGGWVEPAVRRAAALGDGYISPSGTLEDTRERVAVLDDAAAAYGRSEPLPIATATWVAVGDPPASLRAGVHHLYEHYEEWYSSSTDEGGGRQVGEFIRLLPRDPDALPPSVVSGSPQQVLDVLGPLAQEFSHERDHRLCVRLQYPGMSRAETEDHIGRFATDVLGPLRAG